MRLQLSSPGTSCNTPSAAHACLHGGVVDQLGGLTALVGCLGCGRACMRARVRTYASRAREHEASQDAKSAAAGGDTHDTWQSIHCRNTWLGCIATGATAGDRGGASGVARGSVGQCGPVGQRRFLLQAAGPPVSGCAHSWQAARPVMQAGEWATTGQGQSRLGLSAALPRPVPVGHHHRALAHPTRWRRRAAGCWPLAGNPVPAAGARGGGWRPCLLVCVLCVVRGGGRGRQGTAPDVAARAGVYVGCGGG